VTGKSAEASAIGAEISAPGERLCSELIAYHFYRLIDYNLSILQVFPEWRRNIGIPSNRLFGLFTQGTPQVIEIK
jgi:hypothetical protein